MQYNSRSFPRRFDRGSRRDRPISDKINGHRAIELSSDAVALGSSHKSRDRLPFQRSRDGANKPRELAAERTGPILHQLQTRSNLTAIFKRTFAKWYARNTF